MSTGSVGTLLAVNTLRMKVGSLLLRPEAVLQAARSGCFTWEQLSQMLVAGAQQRPRRCSPPDVPELLCQLHLDGFEELAHSVPLAHNDLLAVPRSIPVAVRYLERLISDQLQGRQSAGGELW